VFGLLAVLVAALSEGGCERAEQVRDRFRDETPHEAYAHALARAGLAETALGRSWIRAARNAVRMAATVTLPFEEEGFIAPEAPSAVAYRVRVRRGQRLRVGVVVETRENTRIFVDVFRVPADSSDAFRPVAHSQSADTALTYEPWRTGSFVVRLQPELLRGGRYRLSLALEARLAFPLEGRGVRAIQSLFGAPRDAGRRRHEGVDIFARRGTPVVAALDGVVSRVDTLSLGGKVVWLRDPTRRLALYYAHLDSQTVRAGQRVHTGQVVGFVGNTGNARTTPPHLHFGVYLRGEGAVDPDPFIRPPSRHTTALAADLAELGGWIHVRRSGIRVRAGPSRHAPVLREMDPASALRVVGATGRWFRVQLQDGHPGYVAARLTAPAEASVRVADTSNGPDLSAVAAAPGVPHVSRRASPAARR